MLKPWFNCISCNGLKYRSKSTYTVVLEGKGFTKETYMCGGCAELVNNAYTQFEEYMSEDGRGKPI